MPLQTFSSKFITLGRPVPLRFAERADLEAVSASDWQASRAAGLRKNIPHRSLAAAAQGDQDLEGLQTPGQLAQLN